MVIYEREGKLDHDDHDDAARKPRKRIKKEEEAPDSSSSSVAVTNPNNAETKPQRFICDICHKIFHKHQALGGHMSSHMKYKCVIINTIEEDMKKARRAVIKNDDEHADIDQLKKSEAKKTEGSSTTADEDGGGDYDIGFHDCEQCKRSFATKKALELHKITEHSTEKRVLDIDLNMTYQGGDEEDISEWGEDG